MQTTFLRALLLAGVLALPLRAAAAPTLIGDNVTINWYFPSLATLFATTGVLVGGGVEVACPGANPLCAGFVEPATIDIGATSIVISEEAGSSWAGTTFNGLEFTSLDFGAGISLIGFTLTTDLAGLTNADISFTGNSISFNAAGLSFVDAPYTIRLDLITASAPEPGTLALLGLAVTMAALGRRRYRSRPREH
jgi:PEP-CTERM motif-containing protein